MDDPIIGHPSVFTRYLIDTRQNEVLKILRFGKVCVILSRKMQNLKKQHKINN